MSENQCVCGCHERVHQPIQRYEHKTYAVGTVNSKSIDDALVYSMRTDNPQESIDDGIGLTSMEHPPGVFEKIVRRLPWFYNA